MEGRGLTPLLEGGAFFEAPRWHDGRWWVSDFYRHAVYTVGTDGSEELVLEVEHQPSGLGWLPDGSLLVVSMKDQRVLKRDRDGNATLAAEELMFPNGSVITPDGSTLIVGETAGCRYTAFTIRADGSLSDRRVWAQLAPTPALGPLQEMLAQLAIGPDGCTLDAEGHIWAADEVGARCIRIAPGGAIVDEIRTPEGVGCFACALGGDDGRTLLMCAAPDFLESSRSHARDAVLLTAIVEIPHAGLP